MLEENSEAKGQKNGKHYMTWEEMYKQSLQIIEELYKEIETLRAIVRVQLPIVGEDNKNL